MDPMLSCRVVVIKWVAQYTHLTRNSSSNNNNTLMAMNNMSVSVSTGLNTSSASTHNLNGGGADDSDVGDGTSAVTATTALTSVSGLEDEARAAVEGQLVREILYGCRENVDFVHEVYRQAFLLSFSHSPAIKKVITVYKDWVQMNVPELPPFLLEPLQAVDKEREDFRNVMQGKISTDSLDNNPRLAHAQREAMAIRAGMQNVLQVFVTNAANVFLLEVSGAEYPILLEEQVEMCKRVLNIYRYVKGHSFD